MHWKNPWAEDAIELTLEQAALLVDAQYGLVNGTTSHLNFWREQFPDGKVDAYYLPNADASGSVGVRNGNEEWEYGGYPISVEVYRRIFP